MIEITSFGDPIFGGTRVSPCHDKCQASYNCEGHCGNDPNGDPLTHQVHIDDFSAKYWYYNNA